MQNSSTRIMIIGAVVLVGTFVLDAQLKSFGGDMLYYALLLVGVLALILGFVQKQKDGGVDESLSEDEIAHQALLKTLARMTDADSNIMEVEVDKVREIYKELTGREVTSAEVRVAAKGDLYEEAKFENYLASVQSRISRGHKILIMKGLAHVMRADGVVNPLEVDFFNEIANCLKMEPGDLASLAPDSE